MRPLMVHEFGLEAEGGEEGLLLPTDHVGDQIDRLATTVLRLMNPYGASLNPMLGSDIGHFDVEDMRGVLQEAHELVDHGLMSPEDFRRFALENPVRLHGGMNKDFFKGTKVEAEAEIILAADEARRATAGEPVAAHI